MSILALEIVSSGNRHCASCVGALSFATAPRCGEYNATHAFGVKVSLGRCRSDTLPTRLTAFDKLCI